MPRMSLELVVVAIVILIVALVVISIFTGGMQNFMNIFNFQSDAQIKQSLCQTACVNYCFMHPQSDATKTIPWGDGADQVPYPTYKGNKLTDCQVCTCTK